MDIHGGHLGCELTYRGVIWGINGHTGTLSLNILRCGCFCTKLILQTYDVKPENSDNKFIWTDYWDSLFWLTMVKMKMGMEMRYEVMIFFSF